jgi:surface carbohydrate biosynthesis protein
MNITSIILFYKKIDFCFKFLMKSKYQFYKPPKKKILIFDGNGAFTHYYKSFVKKSEILFIRGEKVNFYILLMLIFKFKRISIYSYINEYINLVKPKYIFHNSFNIRFFEIDEKNFDFSFKKVFTQSELKNEFAFNEFIQNKKNLTCNYIFVWNNGMKKLLSKYISGIYFVTGSIINNDEPKINKKKLKKKLVLVSQYRAFKKIKKNDTIDTPRVGRHGFKYSWLQFHKANVVVAVLLKNFCIKNNIEFNIIGTNIKNQEGEKKFFKKYLQDSGWKYLANDDENKDLKKGIYLSSDSKYVVTIDSTLGYECLSRGQRVGFFSIRSKYMGPNFISFGWPLKLKKEGPCWTSRNSKKDFERVMNTLVFKKEKFWIKIRKNILNDLICYDQGNKIFKKFLLNNSILK